MEMAINVCEEKGSLQYYTFHANACKMKLQVVDSGKQNLYVQDKLLRHPDGFEVLPVADLPQHV